MPTARELLEQADALMRRNRGDAGIPVLTDSVPEAAPARSGASTHERIGAVARPPLSEGRTSRDQGLRDERNRASPAQQKAERVAALGGKRAQGADPLDEPPLLTEAIDELTVEIGPLPVTSAEHDHSPWLGPDTIDPSPHSITGPAPDTVAVVPPVTLRAAEPPLGIAARPEESDPTATRTLRAAGSAATPPPAGSIPPASPEVSSEVVGGPVRAAAPPADRMPVAAPEVPTEATAEPIQAAAAVDDGPWRALAEQISMQVLQRLDLFVDTGLKAQLATHLEPIVARASAQLVEAINDHVGELVRTYVAEAIEREIAQWRQQNK